MAESRDMQGAPRNPAQRRSEPLPVSTKVLYALGSIPDLAVNASINIFLLFYATTVCGIPASLAGAAVALALVIDAAFDPLIGSISDNHHSRFGRRLPFMLGAIPVLAVSFILLFSLPAGWNTGALFMMLVLTSIAVRVSLSCLVLPYMAIGAEISDEDKVRDQLLAWRWTVGMITTLTVVALGLGVFFKGPNGAMSREAYPAFALCLAAMATTGGLLACIAAYRTLDRQHPPPSRRPVAQLHALTEMRETLQNRNFRFLLAVVILFAVGNGVSHSLGLHAATFFWKLPGSQTQFPTFAMTVGLVLGAPLAVWVLRLLERKTCLFLALMVLAMSQMLPPVLKLTGALTLEGPTLVRLLLAMSAVGGACVTLGALAALSLITQITDEHELRFGGRREGMFFAGWWFAQKAASGLGSFISGLALDAIHFPVQEIKAHTATPALPDVVSNALGFICGPGAAIFPALAALTLLGFSLDRGRHAAIVEQLKAKRRCEPGEAAQAVQNPSSIGPRQEPT